MIDKILVFGAGYVGSSLGILLSKNYQVIMVDTDKIKVDKINLKQSPIDEHLMAEYLKNENLNLYASQSFSEHLTSTDLIILALPTNYDESSNCFDTSVLESVLNELNESVFTKTIVIKSTVPIGFTEHAKKSFKNLEIIFVPEFLREGNALEDNIKPSRIVVGEIKSKSKKIANVFQSIAKNDPEVFYMNATDAEAVKLFANTYLATRVSFFNELDSFSLHHNLNSRNIIDGISSDPRIGHGYNNPSFGYGGYCLPKDTKQLLANFAGIPQSMLSAVVNSNPSRKDFIAQQVLAKKPKIVGIFRLVMKKNSDNFRESAIFDIMKILKEAGRELLIYEPLLPVKNAEFNVTHDLSYFKSTCDLVLANRMDDSLLDIQDKVYTRDIYGDN